MEIKCSFCDKLLIESVSQANTTGHQIVHTFNDKSYCSECFEAVQFADMVSKPSKIRVEKKKSSDSKENEESVTKKKIISTINYRCGKCKQDTSGYKCEHCGSPSPLARR